MRNVEIPLMHNDLKYQNVKFNSTKFRSMIQTNFEVQIKI